MLLTRNCDRVMSLITQAALISNRNSSIFNKTLSYTLNRFWMYQMFRIAWNKLCLDSNRNSNEIYDDCSVIDVFQGPEYNFCRIWSGIGKADGTRITELNSSAVANLWHFQHMWPIFTTNRNPTHTYIVQVVIFSLIYSEWLRPHPARSIQWTLSSILQRIYALTGKQ